MDLVDIAFVYLAAVGLAFIDLHFFLEFDFVLKLVLSLCACLDPGYGPSTFSADSSFLF